MEAYRTYLSLGDTKSAMLHLRKAAALDEAVATAFRKQHSKFASTTGRGEWAEVHAVAANLGNALANGNSKANTRSIPVLSESPAMELVGEWSLWATPMRVTALRNEAMQAALTDAAERHSMPLVPV